MELLESLDVFNFGDLIAMQIPNEHRKLSYIGVKLTAREG